MFRLSFLVALALAVLLALAVSFLLSFGREREGELGG
jgi:hypothetical protein